VSVPTLGLVWRHTDSGGWGLTQVAQILHWWQRWDRSGPYPTQGGLTQVMARRARSQERMMAGPDPTLDKLAEMLQRMWERPQRQDRDSFKAPQFDGTGEVLYFIQQFRDVMDANKWNPTAALLHLRQSLKGSAQECGKANTIEAVFNVLKSRFGMTVREARTKLTSLRKEHRATLQEHALEVERLVNVAYSELAERHRQDMMLDVFQTTLGNAYLQRHLLAVHAVTMEEAVKAGNEYLQVRPASGTVVHMVTGEEQEEPKVAAVSRDPMEEMILAIKKLSSEVELLKATSGPTSQRMGQPGRRPRGTTSSESSQSRATSNCWGCGKAGHVRKDCPTNPWNKASEGPISQGNVNGPQQ